MSYSVQVKRVFRWAVGLFLMYWFLPSIIYLLGGRFIGRGF